VALNPSPGAALPLGAEFTSGGARTSLGDALGGKPSALVLVDYRCHFTCGTALGIAADGLAQTGLEAGRDYNLVVIGIDPASTPADAEAMRAAHLAPYPALLASAKFLNGDAAAIASVTAALGYKPVYDAARGEFAHPLGVVILTGGGRVSRVIQGLSLGPDRLKAALLDAREGILSALVEGIRLLCYGHNPLQGAYTPVVQTVLKGGALLTLLGLGLALAVLARRSAVASHRPEPGAKDPLTLSLSPRGEGTPEWSSSVDKRPQPAPSPLGERAGVRGSSGSFLDGRKGVQS
jgi:protein SCO1/2